MSEPLSKKEREHIIGSLRDAGCQCERCRYEATCVEFEARLAVQESDVVAAFSEQVERTLVSLQATVARYKAALERIRDNCTGSYAGGEARIALSPPKPQEPKSSE